MDISFPIMLKPVGRVTMRGLGSLCRESALSRCQWLRTQRSSTWLSVQTGKEDERGQNTEAGLHVRQHMRFSCGVFGRLAGDTVSDNWSKSKAGSCIFTGRDLSSKDRRGCACAGSFTETTRSRKTVWMNATRAPRDVEAGRCSARSLDGFPSLAEFIASDPDHTSLVFRRFDKLAARNLLYLQSELAELEAKQV